MRRCTSELQHQYLDSVFDDVMENQDLSDFTRVMEAFRAAISLGECVRITESSHTYIHTLFVPTWISLAKAWFKSIAFGMESSIIVHALWLLKRFGTCSIFKGVFQKVLGHIATQNGTNT